MATIHRMKRFGYVIMSVAVFLLIARSLWLVLAPRGIGQSAALVIVASSTDASSGAATFRLTNHGQGAIFLSQMNVEAKTPSGWRVVGQVPSTEPVILDGGKSGDLVLAAPTPSGQWRLRVMYYGTEAKGLLSLKGRAEIAMQDRSVSSWGSARTFTGSNSIASREMSP